MSALLETEIERRLRLPAPDEPAELPALVLGPGNGRHIDAMAATEETGYANSRTFGPFLAGRGRRETQGASRVRAPLALVAAAALIVALIAVTLTPGSNPDVAPGSVVPETVAPSPRAAAPPSAAPPIPGPLGIPAGRHEVPWPLGPAGASVHITVPPGWSSLDSPSRIYRDEGRYYGFSVDLAVNTVSRVVASLCPADPSAPEVGPIYVDVGPSVEDLTTALANIVGTSWSAPIDVTVGGYPGKRMATSYDADTCPGPSRRWIWTGDGGWFFLEDGVIATVYVVDVNGHRLVIATEVRGASTDKVAELAAIVASIEIDGPAVAGPLATSTPVAGIGEFPSAVGPDADLRVGRHHADIEGIGFTFDAPARGWEPQRGFHINKSFSGSQGAEATVRWTTFPNGKHTDPCPGMLPVAARPTALELAQAVAAAPGLDVLNSPSDATVGGRRAASVAVTVRDDTGCDPGYFYTYEPVDGGALWTHTEPGDMVMVWIVDVADTLLFVEAQSRDASPKVAEEIRRIVESMRFD